MKILKPFFVGVRAVIIKGDKVLMGWEPPKKDRRESHWETPGGSVKNVEDIYEALKREAKEEIGAKIEVLDKRPFLLTYKSEMVNKKYKGSQGIAIFFLCKLLSKPDIDKATDDEFSEIKYIGKKEFLKLAKQNKIMGFDKRLIPKIMKQLKKW